MFFVFGPSGQMYRGGPEQLSRIASVRRVRRPQALRATGPRGTAQAETVTPAAYDSAFGSLRAQGAVSAYAQTDQGPSVARQALTLGRVIGLLLRADMVPLELIPQPGGVPAAIARARRLVDEVMISPVPTAAAGTGLRRVASVLLDTGLPGLPVTNELGLLEGFISRTDILRAVAADPPLDLWT